MKLSYWENKSWFSDIDFTIIGSGIVGLNCALRLREKFPNAKIIVLEKGVLPQGASTKNAGFACFGSVSEILDDLKTHTEEEVYELVKQRRDGLNLLRKIVGDTPLDFKLYGGYELFMPTDNELFESCMDHLTKINKMLNPLFKEEVYHSKSNNFGFKHIKDKVIFNSFEGQVDTGKMMKALLDLCQKSDIKVLNGIEVTSFEDQDNAVMIATASFSFRTKRLAIATNGFSQQLDLDKVIPARAQVLITKPIKDLHIKGTFHLDKGYYYFRNIDNRILLGGGRNLDFKAEETTAFGETVLVQSRLKELLEDVILPNNDVTIDYSWSGIMGVGKQKNPIVQQVSANVYCGIRLGGMGIAIGSNVGRNLADLTTN